MTARQAEIIELIRKEVKPALGCTEPIAVALATAKAMEIAEEKCSLDSDTWRYSDGYSLRIEVSGNILKNGMGVGIPGTGMVGLHIAAALGAVCGKSSYGLEVLHDLDDRSIAKAKEMVESKTVSVGLAETSSCSRHNNADAVFVVGTSKSKIAKPIIGPPEIIFSGFSLNPPASSINS